MTDSGNSSFQDMATYLKAYKEALDTIGTLKEEKASYQAQINSLSERQKYLEDRLEKYQDRLAEDNRKTSDSMAILGRNDKNHKVYLVILFFWNIIFVLPAIIRR